MVLRNSRGKPCHLMGGYKPPRYLGNTRAIRRGSVRIKTSLWPVSRNPSGKPSSHMTLFAAVLAYAGLTYSWLALMCRWKTGRWPLEQPMSVLKRIRETSVAQLAHFAWGAFIPTTLLLEHRIFHITSVRQIGALSILIPLAKEAIECIPYHGKSSAPWETEGVQSISDGILDFAFFMIGFACLTMMLP